MYNTKALIMNTHFFLLGSFITYIFVLAAIITNFTSKTQNKKKVFNLDTNF